MRFRVHCNIGLVPLPLIILISTFKDFTFLIMHKRMVDIKMEIPLCNLQQNLEQ